MSSVELAGHGTPVALLHAGICDARMWDPVWTELSRNHRVLRHDRPGHGSAPLRSSRQRPSDELAVLVGQHLGGRTALVGASFGGLLALDLALSRPELVSALVLVDAPLPDHDWSPGFARYDEQETAAALAGDADAVVDVNLSYWAEGAAAHVQAQIERMLRDLLAWQLPVWSELDVELARPDLGDRLAELAVPTLVVVGEHDHDDFQVIAARLASTIPGAIAATIPGAGHLPTLEQPRALLDLLLPFLDRVGSPAPGGS